MDSMPLIFAMTEEGRCEMRHVDLEGFQVRALDVADDFFVCQSPFVLLPSFCGVVMHQAVAWRSQEDLFPLDVET